MKKLIIILTIFSGCNTEKQAQKKDTKSVNWLLSRDKLDDFCLEIYPNKDSIVVRDSVSLDTLYLPVEIPGEDSIIHDSIPCNKKCPPVMVVTKTIRKDSIIWQRDAKYENVLLDKNRDLTKAVLNQTEKIKELEAIISNLKSKLQTRSFTMWGLALIIALIIGFKIYKSFKPKV